MKWGNFTGSNFPSFKVNLIYVLTVSTSQKLEFGMVAPVSRVARLEFDILRNRCFMSGDHFSRSECGLWK